MLKEEYQTAHYPQAMKKIDIMQSKHCDLHLSRRHRKTNDYTSFLIIDIVVSFIRLSTPLVKVIYNESPLSQY